MLNCFKVFLHPPYLLGIILFIISCVIILFSPQKRIYDEFFYIPYIEQFFEAKNIIEYTRNLQAPPGPTYSFVHALFANDEIIDLVKTRFLTNCFYLLCAALVAFAAKLANIPNYKYTIILFYGIPFSATSYGLSLTEVPAMLSLCLGILVFYFVKTLRPVLLPAQGIGYLCVRYGLLLIASLCIAVAIWGRQNYLVIVCALPILFVTIFGKPYAGTSQVFKFSPIKNFDLLGFLVATLPAVILAAGLFWIWQGLVPESVRYAASVTSSEGARHLVFGLNIVFLVKSLGYAALAFAFLAPSYFIINWRLIVSSAVTTVVMVLVFPALRFLPSAKLASEVINNEIIFYALEYMFGAALTFAGVYFTLITLIWMWRYRSNAFYLFASLSWLVLLASNMKISHQFSSRYVFVAVPLIVLTSLWHFRFNRLAVLRIMLGFSLSIFLLINYYKSHA
jgi:hypothetical protein